MLVEEMENQTLDCEDGVPSMQEMFAKFPPHHEFILIVPVALCVLTLATFVVNLRATIRNGNRETKGNIATLLSIYPVS